MRLFSIVILTFALLIGITFAILNSEFVMVRYYLGTKSMPLSVLLLLVWVFGITVGLVFSFPKVLKLQMELRRLRRERGI